MSLVNLTTIVARYRNDNETFRMINARMSSVRESIEHLFSLHHNIFSLFHDPARFRLLVSGVEVTRLIFNSFLLLNCYICFNESQNNFMICPPSLEEYLPLNEVIPPAPDVSDMDLGDVYNYHS